MGKLGGSTLEPTACSCPCWCAPLLSPLAYPSSLVGFPDLYGISLPSCIRPPQFYSGVNLVETMSWQLLPTPGRGSTSPHLVLFRPSLQQSGYKIEYNKISLYLGLEWSPFLSYSQLQPGSTADDTYAPSLLTAGAFTVLGCSVSWAHVRARLRCNTSKSSSWKP